MKKLYTNEEYLISLQKGLKTKPNRVEKKLIKILEDIKINYFEFVGDFSFWIGGKNPDFINKNSKKIIELFGNYWHSKEITGVDELIHERQRIKHFDKFGYKTLIIWENEIKDNLIEVKNKIINFLEE